MSPIKRIDCARTPIGVQTSSLRHEEHHVATKASARRAQEMTMHPSNHRGLKCVAALAALATGAVGATALATGPASAATPASFDITGGALSISTPTVGVSLGTQVASTSPLVISGPLGLVTITDGRGGVTSWIASVISTAFTPTSGPADPASNVSYAAGPFTISGGATPTGTDASDLTGVTPVVSVTSTGISSVSWNPTISIAVPGSFAPGHYTATITHSVA